MRIPTFFKARRFALGIDIDAITVRLIMLSRRRAPAQILLEHAGICALPANAVIDAEFADSTAIAAAIAKALATPAYRRAASSARIAMALPCAATRSHQLPLAQLAQHSTASISASIPPVISSASSLDALAPAVFAAAEHLLGIEASALSVDWFCAEPARAPDQLTIVATPRRHIDARLEAAAQAGLMLEAIDGEAACALRACRFAGIRRYACSACYGAVWVNAAEIRLWRLRGASIEHEQYLARNACSKPAFIGALHTTFGTAQMAGVLVAGKLEALFEMDLQLDEIGDALQCPPAEFNPALCCNDNTSGSGSVKDNVKGVRRLPRALDAPASFAVAFGLALRGALAQST